MFPFSYLRKSKVTRMKLKADYLKRQLVPIHLYLSTLRYEGKKPELTAEVLKDIQERERILCGIEKRIKEIE